MKKWSVSHPSHNTWENNGCEAYPRSDSSRALKSRWQELVLLLLLEAGSGLLAHLHQGPGIPLSMSWGCQFVDPFEGQGWHHSVRSEPGYSPSPSAMHSFRAGWRKVSKVGGSHWAPLGIGASETRHLDRLSECLGLDWSEFSRTSVLEINENYVCSISLVQLCATLWTVAHRLLCPWYSPGKNTGVGCHALLQGIFPTQGSNPPLPNLQHCRRILYQLSHLRSPSITNKIHMKRKKYCEKEREKGWRRKGRRERERQARRWCKSQEQQENTDVPV